MVIASSKNVEMLPRHTLQTITKGYLVITNPADRDIQTQSVVSFLYDDTFFINHTKNDMSYRPKDDCLIRLPFNVGYVPFKFTLTVKGVDRRVITGNLSITEIESELYEIPCVRTIQLDVPQSICGEDYKKLITIGASFNALYPHKIEKKRSIVVEKVDPNLGVEPKSKEIQRPNQVWDITANEWKTVPKPYPRKQAWEWNNDTLSWVCLKNEETGDLMPLDRTGMTNCCPARISRAPNSMPYNRTGMMNFCLALALKSAVPPNLQDLPNPSNPMDEND